MKSVADSGVVETDLLLRGLEKRVAVWRIQTELEIEAPVELVWALLTDFEAMSSWNPFIKSISGKLMPSAKLSVQVSPPGKPTMRFRPTVLAVRPERELRWLGKLLVGGLFDGEHYFLLRPIDENRTHLVHGENFSGLLVGPLSGMLAATREGFKGMNAALKELAERQHLLFVSQSG